MGTFAYRALDFQGGSTQGQLDAGGKQAVTDLLREKGLIALDITEVEPETKGDILSRFKRIKSDELTVATRQLATMVSSGMSLLRALYVLEELGENPKLKEALVKVRTDVEGGSGLSVALAKHPKIFNELYTAMVAAGESGGMLEDSLTRIAYQLEKDDSLKRQVKSALLYPTFIGAFAIIVLVALIIFIVPVFVKVFSDFGGELPAITKFTVALSDLFVNRWYLIIAVVAGTVWAFKRWKATKSGQLNWDRFKLKIPWKIGGIVQKVALARFARTYSALIAAGVPMLEAIDITGRTSGNKVVENAMVAVQDSVQGGGTISAPMKLAPAAFPSMVVQMISVGEETGALDQMLSKIADFYEDEVEAAVKALTSILEPLMIVVVGGMVGFIVIAMYMPMFKVYDQIK